MEKRRGDNLPLPLFIRHTLMGIAYRMKDFSCDFILQHHRLIGNVPRIRLPQLHPFTCVGIYDQDTGSA